MPFKCDFDFQNIPHSKQSFKKQPQIENEDVTWSPQYNLPVTRTNKRRALVTTRSKVRWFILKSSHYTGKHVPYNSCTSFIWVLYFISISLDWRLGFEAALQNETHMRASILNTDLDRLRYVQRSPRTPHMTSNFHYYFIAIASLFPPFFGSYNFPPSFKASCRNKVARGPKKSDDNDSHGISPYCKKFQNAKSFWRRLPRFLDNLEFNKQANKALKRM